MGNSMERSDTFRVNLFVQSLYRTPLACFVAHAHLTYTSSFLATSHSIAFSGGKPALWASPVNITNFLLTSQRYRPRSIITEKSSLGCSLLHAPSCSI